MSFTERLPPMRLFIVAMVISFGGSFHFGYHLVLTNPSQEAFLGFLNESTRLHYGVELSRNSIEAVWSISVALMFVGATLGSLLLRRIADKMGRKRGLYLSFGLSIATTIAAIISKWITSFELYAISRFTLGIALSFSLGLSALYLSESSPTKCRGFVNMATGRIVQLGTVVGSVLAIPEVLGNGRDWWLLYLFELIIMLIITCTLPFIDESPGYLIEIGNEPAARNAIRHLHNCSSKEINTVVEEFNAELQHKDKTLSLLGVWRDPIARRGTALGCLVVLSMAFSGIAAINAFAVEILMDTGLTALQASLANVGLAIVSLLGVFVSTLTIDRFGRRPLLLVANTVILVLNLGIFALMFSFQQTQYPVFGIALVVLIALFVVSFSLGPGPLSYFISSEMLGQEARAAGQSWASFTQMLSRSILLAVFLPLKNLLTPAFAYLALFILPPLAATIALYCHLPETKNRSATEVMDQIKEDLPSSSSSIVVDQKSEQKYAAEEKVSAL